MVSNYNVLINGIITYKCDLCYLVQDFYSLSKL